MNETGKPSGIPQPEEDELKALPPPSGEGEYVVGSNEEKQLATPDTAPPAYVDGMISLLPEVRTRWGDHRDQAIELQSLIEDFRGRSLPLAQSKRPGLQEIQNMVANWLAKVGAAHPRRDYLNNPTYSGWSPGLRRDAQEEEDHPEDEEILGLNSLREIQELWEAPGVDQQGIRGIPNFLLFRPEELVVFRSLASPESQPLLQNLLQATYEEPRGALFYSFIVRESSRKSGQVLLESWQHLMPLEREVFSQLLSEFQELHFMIRDAGHIRDSLKTLGLARLEDCLEAAIELANHPSLSDTIHPETLSPSDQLEYGTKRAYLMFRLLQPAFHTLANIIPFGDEEGLMISEDPGELATYVERIPKDSALRAPIQTIMEGLWMQSAYEQGEQNMERFLWGQTWEELGTSRRQPKSAEETKRFYREFTEMNERAAETTGDTERELTRLFTFADKMDIKGQVLDAGSGTGERITEPFSRHMQERHPKTRVVGIDLQALRRKEGQGAEYVVGNIAALPFGDRFFDSIISTWSVINDVTEREEQLAVLAEFSRTLKDGGVLYLDIPFLEGGPGSWKKAAEEYQRRRDKPYAPFGTIMAEFPQASDSIQKHFYIYPFLELMTALQGAGFHVENAPTKEQIEAIRKLETFGSNDPVEFPLWRTRPSKTVPTGRPRWTIIARKVSSPTGLPILRQLERQGQ
jgi:ubiquinone/menaquinone biosynthesis C-methylase UbiE